MEQTDAAVLRVFDTLPTDAERTVWQEWLNRHGADPNDVAVPGWIERDAAARQIVYTAYELDARGQPIFRDGVAALTWRAFQLDAPPLPFPDRP